MQPYNFPQPPANAVTPDSAAQRFFDAPAKPAVLQAIRAEENREFPARAAAPFAVYRIVLRAAKQAAIAWKAARRIIRA